MAHETERKYLVKNNSFINEAAQKNHIVQAYLSSVPERTVRVRIKGDKGWLTIKGIPNQSGTRRFEWETKIPKNDALKLLEICEPGAIEKIRYSIPYRSHIFEVDEFLGQNKGLIVAEVELKSEDEFFEKPAWLGKEVTGQKKYYNAMLAKNPYLNWSDQR